MKEGKRYCIVCKQELENPLGELSALLPSGGGEYCGNEECPRFGLITVAAFMEKEKGEKK